MIPRDGIVGGVDDLVGDSLVEVPEDLGKRAGEAGRLIERHDVVGVGHCTTSLLPPVSVALLQRRRHHHRSSPGPADPPPSPPPGHAQRPHLLGGGGCGRREGRPAGQAEGGAADGGFHVRQLRMKREKKETGFEGKREKKGVETWEE